MTSARRPNKLPMFLRIAIVLVKENVFILRCNMIETVEINIEKLKDDIKLLFYIETVNLG